MRLDCITLRDKKVEELKNKPRFKRNPKLVIITSDLDPSSKVYVNQKEVIGAKCGIDVVKVVPSIHTTEEYIRLVKLANRNFTVDGIIVQVPLPAGVDEFEVIEAIQPRKDVDCMTSTNVGLLHLQKQKYEPCTPKGIISILENENFNLKSCSAVIIGRSNIVGRRIQEMLTQRDATVSLLHSKTTNVDKASLIAGADLVIFATGQKDLITKETVEGYRHVEKTLGQKHKKQFFIDVGITRDENNKLCGDLDKRLYDDEYIYCTTTPGGTGPMTVISLMENVYQSYFNTMNNN